MKERELSFIMMGFNIAGILAGLLTGNTGLVISSCLFTIVWGFIIKNDN